MTPSSLQFNTLHVFSSSTLADQRAVFSAAQTTSPHLKAAKKKKPVKEFNEKLLAEKFPWIRKIDIEPKTYQYEFENEKKRLQLLKEDEQDGTIPDEEKRSKLNVYQDRLKLFKKAEAVDYERRIRARKFLPPKVKQRIRRYHWFITQRTAPDGTTGYSNFYWDKFRHSKDFAKLTQIQMEGAPSIKQGQTFVTGHKSDYDFWIEKLKLFKNKEQIKKTLLTPEALNKIKTWIWVPNFVKKWMGMRIIAHIRKDLERNIKKYETLDKLLAQVSLANPALFVKEQDALKKAFEAQPNNKAKGITLTWGQAVNSGSMAQAFDAVDSNGVHYKAKIVRPEATEEKLRDYQNYLYYQNLIKYGDDTTAKRYRAAEDAEMMVKILIEETRLNQEAANVEAAKKEFKQYEINSFNLYDVAAVIPTLTDSSGKKTIRRSALLTVSGGNQTLKSMSPDNEQQEKLYLEKKKLEGLISRAQKITSNSNTHLNLLHQLNDVDQQLNRANQLIAAMSADKITLHILGHVKQLDDTQGNYVLESNEKMANGFPKADLNTKLTSIDWGRAAHVNHARYNGLQGMMKEYLLTRDPHVPKTTLELLLNPKFRAHLKKYLTLPSGRQHPLMPALINFETSLDALHNKPNNNTTNAEKTRDESVHSLNKLITSLLTQDNERFTFPSKALLDTLPTMKGTEIKDTLTGNTKYMDRPALLDVFYNEMIFNLIPDNDRALKPNVLKPDDLQDQLVTNIPMPYSAVIESRTKFRGLFSEAFVCPYPKESSTQKFSDETTARFFNKANPMTLAEFRTKLHYKELYGELNIPLPSIPSDEYKPIPILLNNLLKAVSENNEATFNDCQEQLIRLCNTVIGRLFLYPVFSKLIGLIPIIDNRLYDASHKLADKWLKDETVDKKARTRFEQNIAHALLYDLQDKIFAAGKAKIAPDLDKLSP